MTGYTGDLGLNSGGPQSVYLLDKTKLDAFTTSTGQPRVLLLRMGLTIKLPKGSITFNVLKPWVQLQRIRSPARSSRSSGC